MVDQSRLAFSPSAMYASTSKPGWIVHAGTAASGAGRSMLAESVPQQSKDVSSGAWQPVQMPFTERHHDVMHIYMHVDTCTAICLSCPQHPCHHSLLVGDHTSQCLLYRPAEHNPEHALLLHPLEHIWAVMCTADAMAAAIKVWGRALQQDCPTGTSATCDQRNVPDGCPCANSSSVLLPLLPASIHIFLQHIDFISTIRF